MQPSATACSIAYLKWLDTNCEHNDGENHLSGKGYPPGRAEGWVDGTEVA